LSVFDLSASEKQLHISEWGARTRRHLGVIRIIQEELETRKLLQRAKEVLMRRRNIKAEGAHRWIQKRSMDSRESMRSIAEAILLSGELV